jgi:hypothetical protein
MRIAAAVLLIGSMGVVYWMQQEKETALPFVAINRTSGSNQAGPSKPASVPGNEVKADVNGTVAPKQQELGTEVATGNKATQLAQAPQVKETRQVVKEAVNTPSVAKKVQETATQELLAYEAPRVSTRVDVDPAEHVGAERKSVNLGVTSQPLQTYNTTETAPAAYAVQVADAPEGKEKSNNLKAMLRKATRMIERRTNINATNDDEELLIGALAIKLK